MSVNCKLISPRRVHTGAEVRGPGEGAPAPAAGRVQTRGQLQRPPGLQAGHGRELHLLQVRDILRFVYSDYYINLNINGWPMKYA